MTQVNTEVQEQCLGHLVDSHGHTQRDTCCTFLQKKAPTYRMKHVQSETFNLDIFLLALVKYPFCNITQIRN